MRERFGFFDASVNGTHVHVQSVIEWEVKAAGMEGRQTGDQEEILKAVQRLTVADPGLSLYTGGVEDFVRGAHVTSVKRKVPYGRGPGPA